MGTRREGGAGLSNLAGGKVGAIWVVGELAGGGRGLRQKRTKKDSRPIWYEGMSVKKKREKKDGPKYESRKTSLKVCSEYPVGRVQRRTNRALQGENYNLGKKSERKSMVR